MSDSNYRKPGTSGPKPMSGVDLKDPPAAAEDDEPCVPPPDWLKLKYALIEWRVQAPHFKKLGILKAQYSLMCAYCVAVDTMISGTELLSLEGRSYQIQSGAWRQRPEVKDVKDAVAEMGRLAGLLSLTKATQGKLSGGGADDPDNGQMDLFSQAFGGGQGGE